MMYSEFVEGTGCKDNAHNYEVFKNLEIMYMNSDMSKAEIYEYGKKLVDNSKSKEQLELEAKINAEIEECKSYIEYYKAEVIKDEQLIAIEYDPMWKRKWAQDKKYHKEQIKQYRNKIHALKWVLA